MAYRYLLESGAPDGYLLEDGSGVLLRDYLSPLFSDTFNRADDATGFGTADGGGLVWVSSTNSDIVSNKGRQTIGAAGSETGRLGISSLDVDVKVMFQASKVTSGDFAIWLRESETPNTKVRGGYNTATDNFFIAETVAGTPSTLGTAAKTVLATTDYWIRFQVEGTAARGKLWADSGSEPGSWDISVSTTVTQTGSLVLFGFATTAYNIDWDQLNGGAIGTNDPAVDEPMPTLGGGYYPTEG